MVWCWILKDLKETFAHSKIGDDGFPAISTKSKLWRNNDLLAASTTRLKFFFSGKFLENCYALLEAMCVYLCVVNCFCVYNCFASVQKLEFITNRGKEIEIAWLSFAALLKQCCLCMEWSFRMTTLCFDERHQWICCLNFSFSRRNEWQKVSRKIPRPRTRET